MSAFGPVDRRAHPRTSWSPRLSPTHTHVRVPWSCHCQVISIFIAPEAEEEELSAESEMISGVHVPPACYLICRASLASCLTPHPNRGLRTVSAPSLHRSPSIYQIASPSPFQHIAHRCLPHVIHCAAQLPKLIGNAAKAAGSAVETFVKDPVRPRAQAKTPRLHIIVSDCPN